MAFIMPVCKRAYRLSSIYILLGFFYVPISYATTDWLFVKNMRWERAAINSSLSAELSFSLSPTAREALHSGIVLYWGISVSISNTHFLAFFNESIYSNSSRYSLRYNTLFNDFRVQNVNDASFRRFSSLSDAVNYLAVIRYGPIILPHNIEKACVVVDLNVLFDKESLPIPLRPIAYFDEGWNLSTNARLECE
jgi:hypothetical protein